MGDPDPRKISTSHVERQNLTIRMQMRRLTRLTNAFSKKWENLWAAHCLHYRFSREVHAVAALNHPNVCILHDVGENYLVMKLIEGPTLAERIGQAPIPVDEALGIARQIAAALDAAHERAIVHRDLKPGNIKLKQDGAVKVLDSTLTGAAHS